MKVRPNRNVVCTQTSVTKEEEMLWLMKYNLELFNETENRKINEEARLSKEEEQLVDFLQEMFEE